MIVAQNQLPDLRQALAHSSVALRLGSYDILHADHQAALTFAASHAGILCVGVMPDAYVARQKGPGRPINNETRRLAAIDAAEGVDYTFLAPGSTLGVARLLMTLRPDVYVEDDDHARETRLLKRGFLRSLGVSYVTSPRFGEGSSSAIIAALGAEEAAVQSSLAFRLNAPRV